MKTAQVPVPMPSPLIGIAKRNDYRFGKESSPMRIASFLSKVMSIDNAAYTVNVSLYPSPIHCEMSTSAWEDPKRQVHVNGFFFLLRDVHRKRIGYVYVHPNLAKLRPYMQRDVELSRIIESYRIIVELLPINYLRLSIHSNSDTQF